MTKEELDELRRLWNAVEEEIVFFHGRGQSLAEKEFFRAMRTAFPRLLEVVRDYEILNGNFTQILIERPDGSTYQLGPGERVLLADTQPKESE
jgi:CRP-like cAMP-binding protein